MVYLLIKKKQAKNWKVAVPVRKHSKKKRVKGLAKKYMGSNVQVRFITKSSLKRLIRKRGIVKKVR
jgi:hypoxanthine-guanine phosphoribosyltransferase